MMSIAERIEVLRGIPLFASFTPDELHQVARSFREFGFQKGDVLTAEGEAATDFLVLASGEAEVWSGVPAQVVGRVGPGEFLGEMSLLLGQGRVATVKASRRGVALALDQDHFRRVIASNAKALQYLSRVLAARSTASTRSTRSRASTAPPGCRTCSTS